MNKLHLFAVVTLAFNTTSHAITVSEVADVIANRNLSIQASRMDNNAEILSLRKENTLPPTAIEFSPFFTSGETGMSSSELIVRQDFEFPSIYHARAKGTHLQQQALEKELDAEIRQLKGEIRNKCIELIYTRKCAEILDQRIITGDSLQRSYEEMYRLGRIGLLELNKVKLTNSDLNREREEARLKCSAVEQDLYALNGGEMINLDSLTYEYNPATYVFTTDLNTLKNNDATIMSAAGAVTAAKAEVAIGKQSWLPTLSLGYRRNTDGPVASNGFMVGAEFPLFSIGKESKVANARLAASNLRLQNAENEAEARLTGAIERINRLQRAIISYQSDNALLLQTMILLRKSLELGQISLTEYYTESDLLYDRIQSEAALEYEFQITLNSLYSLYSGSDM